MELRRSAAWMDMVMSTLAEGVVVTDEKMRVVFANDAFAKLLGKTRLYLLGKPLLEIFPLSKNDQTANHAVSETDLRAPGFRGGPYSFQKESGREKENELAFLEITATSLEQLRQTVFVVRDITEKKKVEDEILRVNKELESFSYSISHDLRAPLRTIDGFSKILVEEYADKLDADGKRFLGNIRTGAQEMGKLIDDILTLSRLGRQAIKAENTNMRELVLAVWNTLIASFPERKIAIDIRYLPEALCDPSLVRQVWMNLLSNAIKFTKNKQSPSIVVSGAKKDGEVEYSVEDNGAGFDMQYADKLFGVFQRLHSSEDFEGTGVGLAIVAHIIRRHGGKVWGVGKVSEGAKFSFTLPASQTATK